MRTRLAALPLLALLTFTACGEEETQAELQIMDLPAAPGRRVEAAAVQPSSAQVDLSFPAEVEARADSTLASPMGGYVEAVLVKAGDRVKKGQVLARVDARTRAAQAEIAVAQNEQAQAELQRIKELGDAVSEQQALAAETQARIAAANADLAQLQLQRSVVVAPFSGKVAKVFVDAGEIAGPGTPVVRLVQGGSVLLNLSVSDRDLPHLHEGQELVFRAQSVPDTFIGTISRIGAAADGASRTFRVEVDVPNPNGALLPGMLGRVSLQSTIADEAIVIPQDWVVTRLDKAGVYLDEDGVAAWRDVELDSFIGAEVVIGSGLDAGDRVITKGARDLAEGDPLIIVRSGTCCTDGRVNW